MSRICENLRMFGGNISQLIMYGREKLLMCYVNDFSGLNSKWAQGTVTVQACKGKAVSTTSDTFGMQT